jgi:hypothetical protein
LKRAQRQQSKLAKNIRDLHSDARKTVTSAFPDFPGFPSQIDNAQSPGTMDKSPEVLRWFETYTFVPAMENLST